VVSGWKPFDDFIGLGMAHAETETRGSPYCGRTTIEKEILWGET